MGKERVDRGHYEVTFASTRTHGSEVGGRDPTRVSVQSLVDRLLLYDQTHRLV